MRVIICGAGQVGYGIAEQLSHEDNEVSVIDTAASEDHMSEDDGGAEYEPGNNVMVEAWSLVLLERTAWRPKP